MMASVIPQTSEVDSFEAYTLYTINQSIPELLDMMEVSKRIAGSWPSIPAVAAAAALCEQVAALASYQSSLTQTIGELDGPAGQRWDTARERLVESMQFIGDEKNLHDPDTAAQFFRSQLPDTLYRFTEVLPDLAQQVQQAYIESDSAVDTASDEETD